MTFVDGIWDAGFDTGDYERQDTFRTVVDLPKLAEQEYDLVIVGAGGAGSAAAIEATDLGLSVIVLEKNEHAGGSTHYSGGTIRLIDDPEGAVEHYYALAQGATPRASYEAFVKGLGEVLQWVEDHGGVLVDDQYNVAKDDSKLSARRVFPAQRTGSAFPEFPFPDSLGLRKHLQPQREDRKYGAALWDWLSGALGRTGAPVVTGAAVSGLIQDAPGGRVRGVVVDTPDGPVSVNARRGVVLACGGFAWDAEYQTQFFGKVMPAVSPAERNAGDGIRLGLSAGADLWHMTGTSTTLAYKVPEAKSAFICELSVHGFILVDQLGRRFSRETLLETHSFSHALLRQDELSGEWDRIPSYLIFDERTRLAGPISTSGSLSFNRRYPWSDDNSVEIERGWITKADTIEELAEKLSLPTETVAETVARFNELSKAGETDQFGRPASETLPLETGPYYGIAVYPSLINTQGGPRRNEHAEVLNPKGDPIPGLFSAGELGSIWHRLYPGGGNVSEALVYGRIAAQRAAALDPAAGT